MQHGWVVKVIKHGARPGQTLGAAKIRQAVSGARQSSEASLRGSVCPGRAGIYQGNSYQAIPKLNFRLTRAAVLLFTHRHHLHDDKHKEHKMQTHKNHKPCQIISFAEAKRERDDPKETESLVDFEITEENQEAELRLLQTIFPGEFEAMVH
jgi:hypothetical protein